MQKESYSVQMVLLRTMKREMQRQSQKFVGKERRLRMVILMLMDLHWHSDFVRLMEKD
jgi:hypothetical protein